MRAVTTQLDDAIDLTDVAGADGYLFVRDGVGFAGRGVAARVPIDEAVAFLAAIGHDDRVGDTSGPIALGAVPFLPGAPASLTVPALTIGKDRAGRVWQTRLHDGASHNALGARYGSHRLQRAVSSSYASGRRSR